MGQAESIEHQRQAGSHLVVGILNELGVDTDTNGAVVAAASDGISRLVSSATGSRPILTPSAVPPSDGGERVGSVDDASGMPALESPVCDGKEISEPMTTSVINEPAVNTDLVVATSAVNGILELIGLLREGDHVRKEKAAEALWGLSASDENKATIVAADGIPLLVALVRDGNAREKENALRTLWKLAFASTTNQDRIAAEGAVDLLEHITSKSQPPRLLVLAAGVLGLLGQHLDSRVRDHIAAYGGTQALLGFLQSHPNDSHTCEALTALLGVCVGGSFVVRSNVRIAGGESILMTVSRSDNKQITELVNRLLEWLTGNVAQLSALCTTMGEVEPLCRHILERLNSALNQGEDNEKIRCVRNRFSTVLKVNGGKAMVERLVSFRSVTGFLDEIHVELDQFECRGGLWRTRWETDRDRIRNDLFGRDATQLVSDLRDSGDAQVGALTLLMYETKKNSSSYSAQELEVLSAVMQYLMNLTQLKVPTREEWFIARHDLKLDDDFAIGSNATIYHGKYMNADVVVKCVEIESERDRMDFLREVNIWHKASHPNVVPLYGACHVGSPFFMVSKDMRDGTLSSYLCKQKKAGLSRPWSAMLAVTRALRFLHTKNIVHGDLKGDNILVEGSNVMIADFGMSFFVSGSRPQFDNLGAIRWRAPEFISRGTVSFEADVYSLGMCIVEAVSGKMPWPTIPDIAVKWHLKEGTFLRQPKEMSRVEWALVCEMCTFEPSRRLKLAQVERRINRFVAMEIDESSRLQFSGSNKHQGRRLSAYQQ